VRLAVAQRLTNGVDGSDELAADVVNALLTLMTDDIDEVRDWSTFSLGVQLHEVDTPQVRDALRLRLSDPHVDTRYEALVGLARRRDPAVLDRIRKELQPEGVYRLAVEAALYAANPSLVPDLVELESWWDVDTALLGAAVRSCRSGEPPDS